MIAPTDPKKRIHWLAELAVDNGEGSAQIEIHDKLLRESLIINIEKQMQRAVDIALDGVMTGGNHLACQLISRLGPDFSERFPPSTNGGEVLRALHDTIDYDMWICWAAIMRARKLGLEWSTPI